LTQQQIYYFNNIDKRNSLLLNGIEITNQKNLNINCRSKSFNLDNINKDTNINNYQDINDNMEDLSNKKMSKDITISKGNKYDKNHPLFTYIIFPKLDNQYFYKSDIKNYRIDFSMFQELKKIDNELISRSHLRRVEIKSNESANYTLLLWLKLWVASLHYQDKQEYNYLFFLMLNIIDKISQHDMGIINNLFEVLVKYKFDEDLILLLYQNILHYQLIPSDFIFRTVSTLINRKKSKSNTKTFNITKHLKSMKEKIDKDFKEGIKSAKNFRKRTFRSIYDTGILKEKISFLIEENCNKCDKKIDMNQFMNKLNDINDDLLWAKCPYCGSGYLPKLKIIFGYENNKNNKLINNTSIVDSVVLYSAKTLNNTIFENTQNNKMINIEQFRSAYIPFFWNLIWHFKIKKLPFYFILPYEENVLYQLINKKPKEKENNEVMMNKIDIVINNEGKNVSHNFKVIFCDYVQNTQEVLEFKRGSWNLNKLIIDSNIIDIYIPPRNNSNKNNYLKSSINNYSKVTNYD